jgi:hypothetical protein
MRNGLFVLLGCTALLAGCGKATEAADAKFDEQFRNACVTSAVKTGAPPAISKRACDCTIEEINKKYGTTEKLTLSQDAAMPILEQCAKKAVQQ